LSRAKLRHVQIHGKGLIREIALQNIERVKVAQWRGVVKIEPA